MTVASAAHVCVFQLFHFLILACFMYILGHHDLFSLVCVCVYVLLFHWNGQFEGAVAVNVIMNTNSPAVIFSVDTRQQTPLYSCMTWYWKNMALFALL